ncbi:MAG TPA: hypothetical protein VMW69_02760 [Spirochaetia bacterium]|nr:hypothetical protein [Spirochaetia bacterium]
MRNSLVLAIVLGIVGLVIGYFLFASVGNGHIPLSTLFGVANGLGDRLRNALTGIVANLPEIRRNILLSGLVGVVAGLVIGIGMRGGRRRRR